MYWYTLSCYFFYHIDEIIILTRKLDADKNRKQLKEFKIYKHPNSLSFSILTIWMRLINYECRPGALPISLHCSGSIVDITSPCNANSSPSIPQLSCVFFPAFIFTDFTCNCHAFSSTTFYSRLIIFALSFDRLISIS